MENRSYTNGHRGKLAEQFVKYRLMVMGIEVLEAPPGLKYDLVAVYGNHIVRVQVKSSTSKRVRKDGSEVIVFSTRNRTTGPYEDDMYDILALVALDEERIVFKTGVSTSTYTAPLTDFTQTCEENTWLSCLDSLKPLD